LADGRKGKVTNVVKLYVGLLSFSWDQECKILNEGPFPAILGLDFLQRAQMWVDLFSRTYSFDFAPSSIGSFFPGKPDEGNEPYLQHLCVDVADLTTIAHAHPRDLNQDVLMAEFP
jgi:hypothetical protein